MTGRGAFFNVKHIRTLSEERRARKKDWDTGYKSKLKGLVSNLRGTDKQLLLRAKSTGAWLSIYDTTVSGTVLSAAEFWGFLCACYYVSPLNLQIHYDGCSIVFSVTHALRCSICGLVIGRHNKIRDKLIDLSQFSFTSESVHVKPLIHQVHTRSKQEIRTVSEKDKETLGGVMVQDLWDHQVNAIIDVKLGDADADTYKYEPMAALLARWE